MSRERRHADEALLASQYEVDAGEQKLDVAGNQVLDAVARRRSLVSGTTTAVAMRLR